MKKPSWSLTDVEKIAQENKYTYYRAPKAAIAALKVGDDVKLSFKLSDPDAPVEAERMWVEIEMIDGSGGFLGRLQNQPRHIKDLKVNDHVRFSECHIMNTGDDDKYPGNDLVEKYFARCFASNKIFRDGEKVTVLFREAPQAPGDSGWRFFTGTETEEYMADPESMNFVSLGAVLRCDDAFVELLEAPEGSFFELNSTTGEFEAVTPEQDDDGAAGSTTVH